MATIVFITFPADGHVNPKRPIAKELVARGHEVLWYTGHRYAPKIERLGVTPIPMRKGRDIDDDSLLALVEARGGLDGIRGLQWDFKHIFIDHAVGYRQDLEALFASRHIDLAIAEPVSFAATVLAPENAPPAVGVGMFPFGFESADTAPFGLGLPPSATAVGRMRNHALHFAVRHAVFGPVQRYLNEKRRALGMPPLRGRFFMAQVLDDFRRYLQATVADFEYPRTDLPSHVEFIGPLRPDLPDGATLPAWWHALDREKPIVLVTQGTIAKNPDHLIVPALAGLENEPLTVVVTAPGWPGPVRRPANAHIEEFIAYDLLLPHVDVMVSNGGYGGVQLALAHGVPLVVAGQTEEKTEINARVAWSGVGINLRTQTPTPAAIRAAVRQVLADSEYRTNARRIAAAMRETDAARRAADLIEEECARDGRSAPASSPKPG